MIVYDVSNMSKSCILFCYKKILNKLPKRAWTREYILKDLILRLLKFEANMEPRTNSFGMFELWASYCTVYPYTIEWNLVFRRFLGCWLQIRGQNLKSRFCGFLNTLCNRTSHMSKLFLAMLLVWKEEKKLFQVDKHKNTLQFLQSQLVHLSVFFRTAKSTASSSPSKLRIGIGNY